MRLSPVLPLRLSLPLPPIRCSIVARVSVPAPPVTCAVASARLTVTAPAVPA
jgi:hypothetical protein